MEEGKEPKLFFNKFLILVAGLVVIAGFGYGGYYLYGWRQTQPAVSAYQQFTQALRDNNTAAAQNLVGPNFQPPLAGIQLAEASRIKQIVNAKATITSRRLIRNSTSKEVELELTYRISDKQSFRSTVHVIERDGRWLITSLDVQSDDFKPSVSP